MLCVAGPEAFDHDEQYLALMISFQSIIVTGSRACIQFFGEEGKGFQPGLKVGGNFTMMVIEGIKVINRKHRGGCDANSQTICRSIYLL